MTSPGQWFGVFLNVTATNPGQCSGVFLNVTVTNPGQWFGVFLNVTVTNPGQWLGLFLIVTAANPGHGTNFCWQGPVPKLHTKFNCCQQTLSLHFTICIWLVLLLLCCVMSQSKNVTRLAIAFDTIKDYNFHKQSNTGCIVVSCYTTSY